MAVDPLVSAEGAADRHMSPRVRRRLRRLTLFLLDSAGIAAIYALLFRLRYDLAGDPALAGDAWRSLYLATLPWLLALRGAAGWFFRIYDWSFFLASFTEAVAVVKSVAVSSLLFFAVSWLAPWWAHMARPPRLVLIAEVALSLFWLGFLRFFPKYFALHWGVSPDRCNAFIYGVNHNAELLLRDLERSENRPCRVVGLLDDDPTTWRTRTHGVPVRGGLDRLPELARRYGVDTVLITVPNFGGARLRDLIDRTEGSGLRFKIVPPLGKVFDGGPKPLWQDVRPLDLLEREPVVFDPERIRRLAGGRTALVTGAAGSIGSEISRQLFRAGVSRLILFDHDENQSYHLHAELAAAARTVAAPDTGLAADLPNGGVDSAVLAGDVELRLEIGSIRDERRMEQLFNAYKPDLVFHAAAHKHVPLMEASPAEALKNNVRGTWIVASAARRHGTSRFVLISTDKAVNPANVMGATKCLAERTVCEFDREGPTRFQAVRFGNVLGSAGSLLPILQRQIAAGGPVTITHRDITRYFMTIPEAVGLVLATAALDEGRLCVLDMGDPVSIDRIARNLIVLAGRTPDRDIEIRYTGLRPGEKMYEELFHESERRTTTSHPKIFRVEDDGRLDVAVMMSDLERAVASGSPDEVRAFLRRYVSGYRPQ